MPAMLGCLINNFPIRRVISIFCLSAACAVAACTQPIDLPSETPSPTVTVSLVEYETSTPQPTATKTIPRVTPSAVILPTPTPFLHTIVRDDTLLGLALQYGVDVDDLLTANPGIDPGFLTIGMTVTIPTGEEGIPVLPSFEPLGVEIADPVCYRVGIEGVWCLTTVANNAISPVENLIAIFSLIDAHGETLADRESSLLLNLLFPGTNQLLAVYFEGQFPDSITPVVTFVTGFPAENVAERYAQVTIKESQFVVASDGMSAEVSGQVEIVSENQVANHLRIVAAAYGPDGQPVGLRAWDSVESLTASETLTFQFSVYSLGEVITFVELYAEGRP